MGKSKSQFDLNRDWIIYNNSIWLLEDSIWMHVIWLGFCLKFIEVRFEIATSCHYLSAELDWMSELSRLCLLFCMEIGAQRQIHASLSLSILTAIFQVHLG